MAKKKTLREIFQDKAAAVKRGFEDAVPAWRERKHDVLTGTVTAVEEDGGTKNITILLEKGAKMDFQPGGAVGVPGRVDKRLADEITAVLLTRNDEEKQLAAVLLQPTAPYPSVLLTAPSRELLEMVDQKLDALPRTDLAAHHKSLKAILQDDKKFAEFQAAYDVSDFLNLFPQMVTAEELLAKQGPAHGNKTYCLIDYGEMQDAEGETRQYLKLSVLPEAGLHRQKLFGEQEEVLHFGETSHYLAGLAVGDELHITAQPKNKADFSLPDDLSGGVVMIGQGNGAVPFMTLLKEIKRRREAGEETGNVHLILAARDEGAVWGVKEIQPYLDDGTITRVDVALSDTEASRGIEQNSGKLFPGNHQADVLLHHATRLADRDGDFATAESGLFHPDVEKSLYGALVRGGDIFISGGEGFKNTMEAAVDGIAARQGKKREDLQGRLSTSKSTMRIQGESEGWSRRIAGKFLAGYLKSAGYKK
ncbi:MAG: hypothetical protein HND56_04250 [Pseudomonadota bacterium]|nr:hypothetical protein [Pseudomonadota bacterium]QKK04950.1 MAG: hypothetical protein HND56_04250 [Pseudomonadota bacterium]